MYKLYVYEPRHCTPGAYTHEGHVAYNSGDIRRKLGLANKCGCRNHQQKSNFCFKNTKFIYFFVKNT